MNKENKFDFGDMGISGVLFNEDCMGVLESLPDEYADLIVTDPPYRTTSRGGYRNSGGMCKGEMFSKGRVFKHNDIDCSAYAPEFYRVLKNGSHCYVMTNHVNLIDMLNTFTNCAFHFIKSLVWDKCNKVMGTFYMSQFEYILFFRKGKGVKINNCGTPDILRVPNKKTKGEDGKNLHDTEKPVELMKILIENSTQPGGLVIDPFVGVGSTALACIESNKKFVCCELDENYANIAKQRIEKLSIRR